MRIVLRNTTTRQDAVYVLDAVGFGNSNGGPSEYWLTAYWGRWPRFLAEGVFGLRRQEKYHGHDRLNLIERTRTIVTEKLCNGYQVMEEHSRLPDWCICQWGQNWRDYQEREVRG